MKNKLLSAPVFEDDEKSRIARTLFSIQLVTVTVMVVALFTLIALGRMQSAGGMFIEVVIIGATIWLNRRGNVILASFILISGMLGMLTYLLWIGNGVHDIVMMGYPLLLIVASMLLNRRLFLVITLLSFLSMVGVIIGEMVGLFTTVFSPFTDYSDIILVGLLYIVVVFTIGLVADHQQKGLERLRQVTAVQAALIEETRRRAEHLAMLNRVGPAMISGLDLSRVLAALYKQLREVIRADTYFVSLYDARSGMLTFPICYDLGERIDVPPTYLHDEPGLTGEVILSRRTLYLPDIEDSATQQVHHVITVGTALTRSFLGIPIILREQVIGVLSVQSLEPNAYTSDQVSLLETIAAQAAIVIQNARLFAVLQEELNGRRRVESALNQRDAILEAVSFAAEVFLTAWDWQECIAEVLERLGKSTGFNHAYIYENHPGTEGPISSSLRYEWVGENGAPSGTNSDQQGITLHEFRFERWYALMRRGEPVSGSLGTLLPEEVERLEALGLKSFLDVPIFIGSQWWGYLGFDDSKKEHEWLAVQVDALRIAASVLSAAIQRQKADEVLRKSEALYRRIIGAAGAVPYYKEYASDTYTFMGEGILALTGYSGEEMTIDLWRSMQVKAVMLGEAAGLSEAEAERLSRQGKLGTWQCDYLIHRRDDELRWIADTAIEDLGPDGVSRGCLGIFQDVTERKAAEAAVRQLNAELEQRVYQRTAELVVANRELESFAYSVAHDLRSPLRGIDGYSKLLLDEYAQSLDKDGMLYLENIRTAAQWMGQLIDNLLKLSRVTRSEMRRVSVDLSRIGKEIVDALRQQEPMRSVEIVLQPDMEVQGDPSLLTLAIENLMRNAWKFTSKTSQARIEMGSMQLQGRTVYFIRDNGAGFDMKYADKLFRPFQRLHSPADFEGTGIGLATVQRIIQRHGGEIWVEALPGNGATFFFTFL